MSSESADPDRVLGGIGPVEPIADDPVLHVENLNVHFEGFEGTAQVLDGIDLSVGKGEVVTVAGETGCGKSVTMKSILGILPQPPGVIPEGAVRFNGTDLLGLSDSDRNEVKGREMSMIFQDPMSSLNPVFTVGEQLTDTAQFGGGSQAGPLSYLRQKYLSRGREEARERVIEMLHEVQLPEPEEIMESYPSQLSGGMKQRVLIAQALLNEPEFLIADEIGTALDVTIHDQIMELLERLIEERDLSVLMITHNLGAARQISDRIYIMYAGRIVETAPTAHLFDSPKHPYTQGLLASVPKLSGEEMAEGIDGFIPEYLDPPSGCRFHPRCPYAHDRCRESPPDRYRTGDQAGTECVLYDASTTSPYAQPTLEETRERMAESSYERSAAITDGTGTPGGGSQ